MDIQFLGAAREVTGSSYLLRAGGMNILVDCGMEQGGDTYENQALPVGAQEIDCVVLTHAHIDHSGMLPALYAGGFKGAIHATPATVELCGIMLRDSAHIQESEAEWKNRKAERSGGKPYLPLYSLEDAEGALKLFSSLPYGETRRIGPGVTLRMTDAGHLLGSASAGIAAVENGVSRTVVFSGDIGNTDQPILKDPQYPEHADYVVMESTYGDRLHGPKPDYIADLADTLQTTFDRGGNVVIPSFAVGRSQEILYFLREIKDRALVKGHSGFPVFMDSPMAIRATEVFRECDSSCFDDEMVALLKAGVNPISFPGLVLCVTAEDSKRINFEKRPCVIISASGMCEAGRVRHHLKHNLWRPECTVLFVGFQSAGTLGRIIADGAKEVKLFGETVSVKAQVRGLKAISGHADRDGLLRWVSSFSPAPRRVFVTHGEEESALAFAHLLEEKGLTASVPYSGDRWSLADAGRQTAQGARELAAKARKPRAAGAADETLSKALRRFEALAQRSGGFANALKLRLAEQIDALCGDWDK